MAPLIKVSIAVLTLMVATAAWAATERWRPIISSPYGVSVLYPREMFRAIPDVGPGLQAFVSGDGQAKLVVGAWPNDKGDPPAAVRSHLMIDAKRYRDLTYAPRGRTWFVLSGYNGDQIYYEKVMLSCGRRIVSVFGLTYPSNRRDIYDPIVEQMEDTFRPATQDGRGRAC